MKTICSIAIALSATPALAHTGHVAAADGHSHWLAAGCLAAAAVIAGLAFWRRRREMERRA